MKQIVLKASGAQIASTTGERIQVTQDQTPWMEAEFILDVTVAATEVGDLLDVYVDFSPDNGTSWVNAIHFTQVLGNGGAKKELAKINANTGLATATAPLNIASDAASGAVRNISLFDCVRYRSAITDAGTDNASFTYSLTAVYR